MTTEPSTFYVENRRSRVGNCITWWAKDGNGYTCDLDRAHRFTLGELRQITRETDVVWPAGVVLAHAVKHVDHQGLDPWRSEHAVAGDRVSTWLNLKARQAAEEDLLRLDERLRQRIDKWDELCRSACPQPDGPSTDVDEAEARVYARCAAQIQAILDGRDPEEEAP